MSRLPKHPAGRPGGGRITALTMTVVERNDPLVAAVAAAASRSDAEVDQLFRNADAIP